MDRWPIDRRIMVAVGVPSLLLVLGSVFVVVQLGAIEDLRNQEAREQQEVEATIDLERSFTDVVETSHAYVLTGDPQNRSSMEASVSSFEDRLGEFEPAAEDQEAYDQLESNASAYLDAVRRAQGHVEEDEMEQAREVLTSPDAETARENTLTAIDRLQTSQQRDIEQTRSEIDETLSDLGRTLLFATLAAVIVAGIVGYDVAHRTGRRIRRIRDTVRDRLDRLAGVRSEEHENLETQTASIDEAEDRLETVHGACRNIDERLSATVTMAAEIEEAAEQGNERLEETLASLDESDRSVTTVVERVLDIGEDLEQLEDVAEDVASIAGQIDMLALNASVDASRGHAEGQGLDEIRDMAERSQERGRRLQEIVESARQESDAAALALEKTGKAVDETRTQALETSQAFEQVEGSLEEGVEEVRSIEELAGEQSHAIAEAKAALAEAEALSETMEELGEDERRALADLEDAEDRLAEVT